MGQFDNFPDGSGIGFRPPHEGVLREFGVQLRQLQAPIISDVEAAVVVSPATDEDADTTWQVGVHRLHRYDGSDRIFNYTSGMRVSVTHGSHEFDYTPEDARAAGLNVWQAESDIMEQLMATMDAPQATWVREVWGSLRIDSAQTSKAAARLLYDFPGSIHKYQRRTSIAEYFNGTNILSYAETDFGSAIRPWRAIPDQGHANIIVQDILGKTYAYHRTPEGAQGVFVYSPELEMPALPVNSDTGYDWEIFVQAHERMRQGTGVLNERNFKDFTTAIGAALANGLVTLTYK